ncbi:MAG: hypothetical protein ACTHVM_07520 [Alkalibacterium gilvum]|uniref:DUF4025 domain-containing protein n=1 Tax=Alkalibacterium gilvum TaxID=1130080 RepID=A0A1H6R887_9LACT|nr:MULTISPECIES: hypothetical protein [Alkalibacterium]MDN6294337.1 hypothetical protein [Alkalibacterium sp.]MDN6296086.1 hypothetical protein [Alkalibacterium sp.]MDN6730102.1 hypothetical protein [Alkalibacterium sp.]SEI49454.1 hypothetical protein SAMN04488113_101139 [Alkalibacterium gilvum]
MDKDTERKKPHHKYEKATSFDPAHDNIVSPDTHSSLGYIEDKFDRNELDESKVVRKAKDETPGNEVEASLNPMDGNSSKEKE